MNPLTTSKKASINDGISFVITNGNAPKIDIKIHDNDTITKPSLPRIKLSFGSLIERTFPNINNNAITPKYAPL